MHFDEWQSPSNGEVDKFCGIVLLFIAFIENMVKENKGLLWLLGNIVS